MLLFTLTLAQAVSIPEPKKQGGNSPLLLKNREDFQKEGGISRKGSLLKKYNKKHEYRCCMLYHIPNVLPLHIKGQFLEDSSLFLCFKFHKSFTLIKVLHWWAFHRNGHQSVESFVT